MPCDDHFRVSVSRHGSTGTLVWEGAAALDDFVEALDRAVGDAWRAGLRRLVARVPADDRAARRALHRSGFRLEGIARAARATPHGLADEAVYALLDTDATLGRPASTAVLNTLMPRKRLIAHALLLDVHGRVALCETSFKPDWELPGGIVEPGESPVAGAVREMREEMGVTLALDRVLVLDWLRPYLGWDDALEVVFGAPALSPGQVAAIVPDGREILGVHWLEPDRAFERLAPFAVGRLRAALAAHADGVTRYLEGGSPP